ncbi:MAG TPA: hypothetical protein VK835_09775 [Bacteroidia bacterium]|jgi:hypothetical protein|nr:hypothetical protein [Bacteroidia bacterium]
MKTNKLTLALAGLMLASAVIVSSCKKKDTTPAPTTKDSDASGASDNHLAESTSNDIVSMGSQASDNTSGGLSSYRTGGQNQILGLSCATVTRDTTLKVITVTFNGTSPCLDGRTRSGTIIYTYSNSINGAKHYRDPGFELDVTSSNYVVDGNAVTIGNKTIKNTTPVGFSPATTNETWSISATITVNKASGGSVTWTCNHVKTLLNTSTVYTNASTPINWPMARIGITGNANGTRSNGETFTVNITNQLVRDFGGCDINGKRPFIQGTFDYSPSGKATRTFDYGSGTCDLAATVTINGVSYPITLP